MARSRASRRATAMGMATLQVDPAATPGRRHSRGPTRTITGTRTAAAPAVTDCAIPPPTPFASSHEAARRNGAGPMRPVHGARQRHCSRLSAGAREAALHGVVLFVVVGRSVETPWHWYSLQ